MAQAPCLAGQVPCLGPRPLKPVHRAEAQGRPGASPTSARHQSPTPLLSLGLRGIQGKVARYAFKVCLPRSSGYNSSPGWGPVLKKYLTFSAALNVEILGPFNLFRGPGRGLHQHVRTGTSLGLW